MEIYNGKPILQVVSWSIRYDGSGLPISIYGRPILSGKPGSYQTVSNILSLDYSTGVAESKSGLQVLLSGPGSQVTVRPHPPFDQIESPYQRFVDLMDSESSSG